MNQHASQDILRSEQGVMDTLCDSTDWIQVAGEGTQ